MAKSSALAHEHPVLPRVVRIASVTVLAVFTLAVVYPLLAVFFNSFKTQADFFTNPWWLPEHLVLGNYTYAWTQARIPRFMLNSLVVAVLTTGLTLVLASLAGYAFARFRFRWRNGLFLLFAILLIVPAPISIIPLYVIVAELHLIDTYWALVLPYAAGAMPLSIYLLRAFFATIPSELTDAARIDGCSDLSAFLRVVLPISRPGIATVGILAFVHAWNEFFLALIFIHNQDLMTLPLGLQTFFYQYHVEWPYYFAGLSTAIVPIIIVYVALQRQFIRGMTAGAVR
ncbi:carbohydrate ABC transporter permease [Actinopolymorpha pittospori]|uniref:Raffinose/stachyose/melibiose transport system permease protein n=1 Tax=Actinopolymorpha pittospori TaxID=648752 RepID=A0A927N1A2_9ACTN|nr:carbohydrate ABC transporter permease [Actinopolymorpha pittospori]MBE1608458.1 raffinose/stachyose/melibiose transport system permease protein [Actinopolymorpha pittospori]